MGHRKLSFSSRLSNPDSWISPDWIEEPVLKTREHKSHTFIS